MDQFKDIPKLEQVTQLPEYRLRTQHWAAKIKQVLLGSRPTNIPSASRAVAWMILELPDGSLVGYDAEIRYLNGSVNGCYAIFNERSQLIEVLDKEYFDLRHTPAANDQEVARVKKQDRLLRQLLCLTYCAYPYLDDGELQDNTDHPTIDFLRDSAEEIQRKMRVRSLRKINARPAPPAKSAIANAETEMIEKVSLLYSTYEAVMQLQEASWSDGLLAAEAKSNFQRLDRHHHGLLSKLYQCDGKVQQHLYNPVSYLRQLNEDVLRAMPDRTKEQQT